MPDRRPAEGRRVLLVTLGVLAMLALVPLLGDLFWTRLVTRVMIYGLVALSLDLILGLGGMVSFGHAAWFGLGGYVVAISATHGLEDALVVWPLAVLVAGGAALVVGAISLRTAGVSFIMITLAFAQMIYFLFASLRPYGADDGLAIWRRNLVLGFELLSDHTVFFYLVLAILALALAALLRLRAARFGLLLRGVRQNEARMTALGFPTFRYKLAAFTLAGSLAGLAGALLANHALYVSPSTLHWTTSGELIVMVVLGGMGSLIGPVLGATGLLLAEEALSARTAHWQAVLGAGLVLAVLFTRQGLFGWLLGRRG
jgi:branched-chain amino acid transport system permease protein